MSLPAETVALRFTPPNFRQPITVPFPSLPVCEICKRMSKSRKHCRTKCGHPAPPWCTAYICITIEGSRCIGTDEAPIDAHSLVVKEAQPRPYRLLSEFEDPKTPCCASCKKANRTVAWCRERMAHRYVPWNTAFVRQTAKRTRYLVVH